jgi:large subunit ribosomal protein L27
MLRNAIRFCLVDGPAALQAGSSGQLIASLLSPASERIASGGFEAFIQIRSATKKAGGTASQKNATIPKNLGVKMLGGELAFPGQIIVRQRGTKFHAGQGVGMGKDHTIFSKRVGFVAFSNAPHTLTNGKLKSRVTISVTALVEGNEAAAAEQDMVQRRAQIKRDTQRYKPLEPSLFFSASGLRGTRGPRRPSIDLEAQSP